MTKQLIAILCLLPLITCKNQGKINIEVNRDFKIPIAIQEPTKDTIHLSKSDFLDHASFRFYGKYKFADTINLDKKLYAHEAYIDDFISEYSGPRGDDTLTTDGFQLFADYKTNIYTKYRHEKKYNNYFPVYVVNETSQTKVFIGKDSYVFGLQEAVDTSYYDTWRPIESKGFDFCGNGYFGLKVHPGEFVVFLVPKYEGDEKQPMRIRLKVGESIYLSQSYEGVFNRKQFNIKKDTWSHRMLKEDKVSAIQWLFYGAIPKGYETKK
jgi:hypothetical protein